MGYSEYLTAREFLTTIGQPVITYLFLLAILQFSCAIFYLIKKKNDHYNYLVKCIYINTVFYILGFIFLIWFHFQIYKSVSIDYPPFLSQMIPVETSRFIIPSCRKRRLDYNRKRHWWKAFGSKDSYG